MSDKLLLIGHNLRGAYLACELSGQGYDVTLLNLHYNKNEIINSDFPFSYVIPEKQSYFQKQFLASEGGNENSQGLTFWLDDGPVSLNSEFSEQVIQEKGLDLSEVLLWPGNSLATKKNRGLTYEFDAPINGKKPTWPIKLSESDRIDLMNLCASADVNVINGLEGLDIIAHPKKNLIRFGQEVVEYSRLICLMSAFELNKYSSVLSELVFSGRSLNPEWVWVYATFNHNFCEGFNSSPEQFFIISDHKAQWIHSNFIFINKSVEQNKMQVWLKWPFNELANIKYLTSEYQAIKDKIEQKIIGLRIENFTLAQGLSDGTYHPPAYLFNSEQLNNFLNRLPRHKTRVRLGPEFWDSWNLPDIHQKQFQVSMEALQK